MRPSKPTDKKTWKAWKKASRRAANRNDGPSRQKLLAYARLVWPPLLALTLYGLLAAMHIFSPLYLLAHLAALLVLCVWIARALHGARGYWAHGTHGRLALLFIAAVGFGSCWGPLTKVDVRIWATPPAYTLHATTQVPPGGGEVLSGSQLHIGLKSDKPVQLLVDGVAQTLSGDDGDEIAFSLPVPQETQPRTITLLLHRGWHRLGLWRVLIQPDTPPQIVWTEAPEITNRKTIRFAYEATDDFAVESVFVRVTPVTLAPGQPGGPIDLPLSTPRVGKVSTASYADLTSLPWSGQNVTLQLFATDGALQQTGSVAKTLKLPVRRFRNPFARALIEEREKLIREPGAAARSEAANVMAGIARQQGLFKSDAALYLALRAGAVRLVLDNDDGAVTSARRTLWQAAMNLEEGLLGQSREALARTQQDLAEALARGAEIGLLHSLMRALDLASGIYFRALEVERARQGEALREMNWLPQIGGEAITAEDFRARLDDLARLMAEGPRMALEKNLAELQRLTENMRTAAPELTPSQDQMAQQVAALRSLVRGQRQVMQETESAQALTGKTDKDRRARREALARALARQQALLSALQDMAQQNQQPPGARSEIKDALRAMLAATTALQAADAATARRQQAEASALLENSALHIAEKMRQSLTASGP